MKPRHDHMQGFSALELLVIVVIVCVVAAIGVPVLHARAKISVLSQNLQTLGQMVQEQVIEGYSCDYRPSGEGDSTVYLSTRLEECLNAMGKAGYANPTVASGDRRVVLNSSTITTDPAPPSPAVFITDSPECRYLAFPGLDEDDSRLLAGSLVVSFNLDARTVDVFYVTGDGKRSADVMTLPVS
jgi:type II secretory pathway pseudopilin PulG